MEAVATAGATVVVRREVVREVAETVGVKEVEEMEDGMAVAAQAVGWAVVGSGGARAVGVTVVGWVVVAMAAERVVAERVGEMAAVEMVAVMEVAVKVVVMAEVGLARVKAVVVKAGAKEEAETVAGTEEAQTADTMAAVTVGVTVGETADAHIAALCRSRQPQGSCGPHCCSSSQRSAPPPPTAPRMSPPAPCSSHDPSVRSARWDCPQARRIVCCRRP